MKGSRSMIRALVSLAGLFAVAACAPPQPLGVARFAEPALGDTTPDIPEGADPEACYGHDEIPAVVETITEQVMVQPPRLASDGSVLAPGVYRSVTRQRIVREREDIWFETPCPDEMTPEFVAALQRALQVRGYYQGEITGQVNAATRQAVRAFQHEEGLNSPVLSIAAAKRLGLVAYDRDETLNES